MPDVYYSPERFGLTKIAEVDYSSGHYEFDIRCVWRHEDGRFLTARDAGCSCPSPFEFYQGIDKLEPVSMEHLRQEARENRMGASGDVDYFLRTVDAALRAAKERPHA